MSSVQSLAYWMDLDSMVHVGQQYPVLTLPVQSMLTIGYWLDNDGTFQNLPLATLFEKPPEEVLLRYFGSRK